MSWKDPAWTAFLQWALPRRGFRWRGFRRVRRQVVRRLVRRLETLHLEGPAAYRVCLEANPAEWAVFDALCRVTISRFFRDRQTYAVLERELDAIASRIGTGALRIWSAGCASGEEPYSIAISWHTRLARRHPSIKLEVLATDIDEAVLRRAIAGAYEPASLAEVPDELRGLAFERRETELVVPPQFRESVRFERHDIRDPPIDGPFHAIACRNLAFTYFDEAMQARVLEQLLDVLLPDGLLILGGHETIPPDGWPLVRVTGAPIWRRHPRDPRSFQGLRSK
jgi:chemotaxis protein methyltransferase CheR